MQRQQQSLWLYIGLALIGAGIFAADLFTPLGLAVWILYVIPIALTLLGRHRDTPIVAAAISTVLMVITVMTDAPGVTPSVAYTNRACGVAVIWAIAILARTLLATRAQLEEEAWIRQAQTAIQEPCRVSARCAVLATARSTCSGRGRSMRRSVRSRRRERGDV